MGKQKTRRKKVPSPLRKVIAANVEKRAKKLFPGSKNLPMAIRNASAEAISERMTKSHVQHILEGVSGISLEQLDMLAKALDLLPYQLLIQDLDPENPQIAKGATVDERELYKRIAKETKDAVKEALTETNPGYKIAKSR